jgi:hypothetical protein
MEQHFTLPCLHRKQVNNNQWFLNGVAGFPRAEKVPSPSIPTSIGPAADIKVGAQYD